MHAYGEYLSCPPATSSTNLQIPGQIDPVSKKISKLIRRIQSEIQEPEALYMKLYELSVHLTTKSEEQVGRIEDSTTPHFMEKIEEKVRQFKQLPCFKGLTQFEIWHQMIEILASSVLPQKTRSQTDPAAIKIGELLSRIPQPIPPEAFYCILYDLPFRLASKSDCEIHRIGESKAILLTQEIEEEVKQMQKHDCFQTLSQFEIRLKMIEALALSPNPLLQTHSIEFWLQESLFDPIKSAHVYNVGVLLLSLLPALDSISVLENLISSGRMSTIQASFHFYNLVNQLTGEESLEFKGQILDLADQLTTKCLANPQCEQLFRSSLQRVFALNYYVNDEEVEFSDSEFEKALNYSLKIKNLPRQLQLFQILLDRSTDDNHSVECQKLWETLLNKPEKIPSSLFQNDSWLRHLARFVSIHQPGLALQLMEACLKHYPKGHAVWLRVRNIFAPYIGSVSPIIMSQLDETIFRHAKKMDSCWILLEVSASLINLDQSSETQNEILNILAGLWKSCSEHKEKETQQIDLLKHCLLIYPQKKEILHSFLINIFEKGHSVPPSLFQDEELMRAIGSVFLKSKNKSEFFTKWIRLAIQKLSNNYTALFNLRKILLEALGYPDHASVLKADQLLMTALTPLDSAEKIQMSWDLYANLIHNVITNQRAYSFSDQMKSYAELLKKPEFSKQIADLLSQLILGLNRQEYLCSLGKLTKSQEFVDAVKSCVSDHLEIEKACQYYLSKTVIELTHAKYELPCVLSGIRFAQSKSASSLDEGGITKLLETTSGKNLSQELQNELLNVLKALWKSYAAQNDREKLRVRLLRNCLINYPQQEELLCHFMTSVFENAANTPPMLFKDEELVKAIGVLFSKTKKKNDFFTRCMRLAIQKMPKDYTALLNFRKNFLISLGYPDKASVLKADQLLMTALTPLDSEEKIQMSWGIFAGLMHNLMMHNCDYPFEAQLKNYFLLLKKPVFQKQMEDLFREFILGLNSPEYLGDVNRLSQSQQVFDVIRSLAKNNLEINSACKLYLAATIEELSKPQYSPLCVLNGVNFCLTRAEPLLSSCVHFTNAVKCAVQHEFPENEPYAAKILNCAWNQCSKTEEQFHRVNLIKEMMERAISLFKVDNTSLCIWIRGKLLEMLENSEYEPRTLAGLIEKFVFRYTHSPKERELFEYVKGMTLALENKHDYRRLFFQLCSYLPFRPLKKFNFSIKNLSGFYAVYELLRVISRLCSLTRPKAFKQAHNLLTTYSPLFEPYLNLQFQIYSYFLKNLALYLGKIKSSKQIQTMEGFLNKITDDLVKFSQKVPRIGPYDKSNLSYLFIALNDLVEVFNLMRANKEKAQIKPEPLEVLFFLKKMLGCLTCLSAYGDSESLSRPLRTKLYEMCFKFNQSALDEIPEIKEIIQLVCAEKESLNDEKLDSLESRQTAETSFFLTPVTPSKERLLLYEKVAALARMKGSVKDQIKCIDECIDELKAQKIAEAGLWLQLLRHASTLKEQHLMQKILLGVMEEELDKMAFENPRLTAQLWMNLLKQDYGPEILQKLFGYLKNPQINHLFFIMDQNISEDCEIFRLALNHLLKMNPHEPKFLSVLTQYSISPLEKRRLKHLDAPFENLCKEMMDTCVAAIQANPRNSQAFNELFDILYLACRGEFLEKFLSQFNEDVLSKYILSSSYNRAEFYLTYPQSEQFRNSNKKDYPSEQVKAYLVSLFSIFAYEMSRQKPEAKKSNETQRMRPFQLALMYLDHFGQSDFFHEIREILFNKLISIGDSNLNLNVFNLFLNNIKIYPERFPLLFTPALVLLNALCRSKSMDDEQKKQCFTTLSEVIKFPNEIEGKIAKNIHQLMNFNADFFKTQTDLYWKIYTILSLEHPKLVPLELEPANPEDLFPTIHQHLLHMAISGKPHLSINIGTALQKYGLKSFNPKLLKEFFTIWAFSLKNLANPITCYHSFFNLLGPLEEENPEICHTIVLDLFKELQKASEESFDHFSYVRLAIDLFELVKDKYVLCEQLAQITDVFHTYDDLTNLNHDYHQLLGTLFNHVYANRSRWNQSDYKSFAIAMLCYLKHHFTMEFLPDFFKRGDLDFNELFKNNPEEDREAFLRILSKLKKRHRVK